MRDTITTNLMAMIRSLNSTVKELQSTVSQLNRDVKILYRENDELADSVEKIKRQGNATNQYGRRSNVVISGIPHDVKTADLEEKAVEIGRL